MNSTIAIIGAGPAGIYTTLMLSGFLGEIHLFEQNTDIGEKLQRTGGGRMNVANTHYNASCFFSYTEDLKNYFFKNTTASDIIPLLQQLEIEYIWESDRAILKSQNAKAEVARLKNKIQMQSNTYLRTNTKITNITPQNNGFVVNNEFFNSVVIASGGRFRIGDLHDQHSIYSLITELGHTITHTSPSLSSLLCSHHPLKNISGITFPFQVFTKNILPEKNDGLITHFGFSGPVVLDFTAYWNTSDEVYINFIPHLSKEQLNEFFHTMRKTKKTNIGVLSELVPKKLALCLLELSQIIPEKRIAELSKKQEQTILQFLCSYALGVPKTLDYAGCWTTKGGVSLKEIDMNTLESTKYKNLFFAGEVMDINGLCGGYHISFAMQCAHTIAQSFPSQHTHR